MSWYSPLASDQYASHWPSGDHAGSRSRAPGVRVRLRAVRGSGVIVNRSPRASITARWPDGARSQPPMNAATLR